MARRLDNLLLGLVGSVCAVCWSVLGTRIARARRARVCDWLGYIVGTTNAALFETMGVLLSPELAWAMWVVIFVLMLTYLVTTCDSAILIVNTINAAGDASPKARVQVIAWGIALGGVMASLLLLTQTDADGNTISGLKALSSAMIVGALPFFAVMLLMAGSIVKAIYRDTRREQLGVAAEKRD